MTRIFTEGCVTLYKTGSCERIQLRRIAVTCDVIFPPLAKIHTFYDCAETRIYKCTAAIYIYTTHDRPSPNESLTALTFYNLQLTLS